LPVESLRGRWLARMGLVRLRPAHMLQKPRGSEVTVAYGAEKLDRRMNVAACERLPGTSEDRTDLLVPGEAGARGSSSRRISRGRGDSVLKHPLSARVSLSPAKAPRRNAGCPTLLEHVCITASRSWCI
jgi:hypothetical protein